MKRNNVAVARPTDVRGSITPLGRATKCTVQVVRGSNSGGAQAVWQRVVAEMGSSDVILAADTDVLRCYCEAVSQYLVAMHLLASSSPLVKSRGDLVKNPLHQIVRESRDAVRLFARDLGLSPSARAGLNVELGALAGDMAAEIGPPPRLRVVGGGDAGRR